MFNSTSVGVGVEYVGKVVTALMLHIYTSAVNIFFGMVGMAVHPFYIRRLKDCMYEKVLALVQ